MLEKGEQIQRFFELCENSSFSYCEELLRGIETKKYVFERSSNSEVPSKQLIDIYRVRAKIVARKNSQYARRLKVDIQKFISELEKIPNEKVNSWVFWVDESSEYICFEGVNSKKILGCFLTVDRRKVSESEWEKLWSE